MLGELTMQVGKQFEQAATQLTGAKVAESAVGNPDPAIQPGVGDPAVVNRSAVAGMSLEGMQSFNAGPGMSATAGLSPKVAQTLTVNPQTMPWTAQAQIQTAQHTPGINPPTS